MPMKSRPACGKDEPRCALLCEGYWRGDGTFDVMRVDGPAGETVTFAEVEKP